MTKRTYETGRFVKTPPKPGSVSSAVVERAVRKVAKLLDTYDVAAMLGVSPRTVCLWAEIGELPGLKIGQRKWKFLESDIIKFLEKGQSSK
jgi:excisionase family DNA binding protein